MKTITRNENTISPNNTPTHPQPQPIPAPLPEIRATLHTMAEPEYQRFASKLLPGVENILGVRLPKLRKYARQIGKTYGVAYLDAALKNPPSLHPLKNPHPPKAPAALNTAAPATAASTAALEESNLEYEYMEEILLQGMVIGSLKVKKENPSHEKSPVLSLEQIQRYIRQYLPKINNWSTCDSFCAGLKAAKEYPEQMWEFIQDYLESDRDYDVRFGIVMIINYFIQDTYLERLFEIFNRIGKKWNTDCYYVEMALAWAISICYVKYPDRTLLYLEDTRDRETALNDFTYNKSLQKIVESHCVTPEKKAEIKLMKRTK